MNKEKLKQYTIKAFKDDCDEFDFQECKGLKIDGFSWHEYEECVTGFLRFKDSFKVFSLSIAKSCDAYKDIMGTNNGKNLLRDRR